MIKWIRNYYNQGDYLPADGLNYWRERVFRSILLVIVVFGFFPYCFGMLMSFTEKVYSVAILDTLVYGAILFTIFSPRLPLFKRIYIIVGLVLFIGIGLTLILGAEGAGFNYIIGYSVLVSLLIGLRGAIYSLFVVLGLILLIGAGLYFNIFGDLGISEFTPVHWFTVSINTLAISALSSLPLAILVNGLKSTIADQNNLQNELEEKIILLEEARINAEEADKLKTKFLANMSHEIRTPLNSIMGFSELVMSDMFRDQKEMKFYLQTINQSGSYLLNIIENILDFSMIESSQLKHTIQPFNLKLLLIDLQNIYELSINSKEGVSIYFEGIDEAETLTLISDEQRIKQVLINLINNAFKFTDKGQISVGYNHKNSSVEFYVKDTGVGIHPEDQQAIFRRFVKIEGQNKVKEGTGLGLPISKGIIETLGGSINLISEPDKGSTFYFTIPIE